MNMGEDFLKTIHEIEKTDAIYCSVPEEDFIEFYSTLFTLLKKKGTMYSFLGTGIIQTIQVSADKSRWSEEKLLKLDKPSSAYVRIDEYERAYNQWNTCENRNREYESAIKRSEEFLEKGFKIKEELKVKEEVVEEFKEHGWIFKKTFFRKKITKEWLRYAIHLMDDSKRPVNYPLQDVLDRMISNPVVAELANHMERILWYAFENNIDIALFTFENQYVGLDTFKNEREEPFYMYYNRSLDDQGAIVIMGGSESLFYYNEHEMKDLKDERMARTLMLAVLQILYPRLDSHCEKGLVWRIHGIVRRKLMLINTSHPNKKPIYREW